MFAGRLWLGKPDTSKANITQRFKEDWATLYPTPVLLTPAGGPVDLATDPRYTCGQANLPWLGRFLRWEEDGEMTVPGARRFVLRDKDAGTSSRGNRGLSVLRDEDAGSYSHDLEISGLTQQMVGIPHYQQDNDFETYVLSMLGQYILAYEYHSNFFSGLRIFCRMDTSVYSQQDRFHFFINEMTHSHNTGLFSFIDQYEELESAYSDLSLTLEHAVVKGFLSNGGLGKTPLPVKTT